MATSLEAFDPRWLCLYNDEKYGRVDFPYRRFDPDHPLHWTRGQWLDTGEAVYLPAFAVWLANAFEEEALCQVTSNGLAAGQVHASRKLTPPSRTSILTAAARAFGCPGFIR
jgi:YcaO cyclodehydratase, ATP-ad Mg2+-binding